MRVVVVRVVVVRVVVVRVVRVTVRIMSGLTVRISYML